MFVGFSMWFHPVATSKVSLLAICNGGGVWNKVQYYPNDSPNDDVMVMNPMVPKKHQKNKNTQVEEMYFQSNSSPQPKKVT